MTATKRTVDIPTVAGLAIVAYLTTTLLHEAGGHGGMCLALGDHPVGWGAYYFDCDTHAGPAWKFRLIAAAGSTVNLIVALITGIWLETHLFRPVARGIGAALIWLFFVINALTWAGYFLFSGVMGFGDWGTGPDSVLTGLQNGLLLRIAMAISGGFLYFLCIRLGARWLSALVGGAHRELGRRIAFTAYVTGGATAVVIGLFNPVGWVIVLLSAAASSLGGTIGLFNTVQFMPAEPAESEFTLPRNWLWIALGIATALVYGWVLGPTIRLG